MVVEQLVVAVAYGYKQMGVAGGEGIVERWFGETVTLAHDTLGTVAVHGMLEAALGDAYHKPGASLRLCLVASQPANGEREYIEFAAFSIEPLNLLAAFDTLIRA